MAQLGGTRPSGLGHTRVRHIEDHGLVPGLRDGWWRHVKLHLLQQSHCHASPDTVESPGAPSVDFLQSLTVPSLTSAARGTPSTPCHRLSLNVAANTLLLWWNISCLREELGDPVDGGEDTDRGRVVVACPLEPFKSVCLFVGTNGQHRVL